MVICSASQQTWNRLTQMESQQALMCLTHFLTQGKRRIILTYRRVIQPHHKVPFSYDCFVHLLSIIIFSTGASAMTSIPKPNHIFSVILLHCIVYLYDHIVCEI